MKPECVKQCVIQTLFHFFCVSKQTCVFKYTLVLYICVKVKGIYESRQNPEIVLGFYMHI